jgi:hypothetical protein
MEKRLLRLLFLSGAVLALLTACEYDYIVPTPPPPVIENDTISYSEDIQPIFNAECISCHPAVYKPDLTVNKSYNALISGNYVTGSEPATSLIYTKVNTGGTMAGYTNAANVELIRRWIVAGAKND